MRLPFSASCTFRLLAIIAVAMVTTVIFITHIWLNHRVLDYTETVLFSTSNMDDVFFYADDVTSYTQRKLKEFEYEAKLSRIPDTELSDLNAATYRNMTFQWQRSLLPEGNDLADIGCLSFLDRDYGVSVSVVIVYRDEVVLSLLRTLTVLTHRTLPHYLHEVVLVDDASSKDNSDEILMYCASQRIPVRFLRNERPLGIANSRIRGMEAAEGDVIAILDSHMEVMEVWLEPLLHVISEKPDALAVPCVILTSEEKLSREEHSQGCIPTIVLIQHGFGLIYYDLYNGMTNATVPYSSPALLGGAIVGFKSTLLRLYPRELASTSWSIENNRLSVRAWLCAGGIHVSSCSQVAHIGNRDGTLHRYVKDHPTIFDDLITESVAEILNYIPKENERKVFVERALDTRDKQDAAYELARTIAASFPEVRSCRRYAYFRDEVIPGYLSYQEDQFTVMGSFYLQSNPGVCLALRDFKLAAAPCQPLPQSIESMQIFGITRNGAFRSPQVARNCLDTGNNMTDGSEVVFKFGCHVTSPTEGKPHASQRFEYHADPLGLLHEPSGRCVELVDNERDVVLRKCDGETDTQKWVLETPSWFRMDK